MTTIFSLIRKLQSIPSNTPVTKSIYREMLRSYSGVDYIKNVNHEYIFKNKNDIVNRHRLFSSNFYDNNLNWCLSMSVLPENSEIKELTPGHLKLLSGNLSLDSSCFSLELKEGTISIPSIHNIKNKSKKNAIFLTVHSKTGWENIPLL